MTSLSPILSNPTLRGTFITTALFGFSTGLHAAFMPVWVVQVIGATPVELGVLLAVGSGPAIILMTLLTPMTDRPKAMRPLIVVGMTTSGLGAVFLLFATNLLMATIGYAMMACSIIAYPMFIGLASLGGQPSGMSISMVRLGQSVGGICGSAVGSLLVAIGGFNLNYASAALVSILAAVTAIVLIPRPQEAPRLQRGGRAWDLLADPKVILFATIGLFIHFGFSSSFRFTPLFVVETLGQPPAMVGVLATIAALANIASTPLIGALANRFNPARIVYIGFATQGILLALAGLSATLWQLALVQALVGVSWAVNSTIPYMRAQMLRPDRPSGVVALYYTTFQFTQATGGLVGGIVAESAGLRGVFFFSSALCAVASVLSFRPSRR